jgi:deoxyadenosine/deoxycytidine kinase
MKIHVSVEGNIAAGKSTFCNKLKEYFESKNLPVEVAPEPIEEWVAWRTASGPVNLLQKQYEDPVNNAVHFQLAALVSKCEQLNSFSETESLITKEV